MNRPIGTQSLAAPQDLFHKQVERLFLRILATKLCVPLLQLCEIATRVPETVHVINPQTGGSATLQKLKREAVRRIKNLRQLHTDRGQVVDIKKPPVIDFLSRDPP